MKYDFSNWKAEDQEITRLIKQSYNGEQYKFFQDVVDEYTFKEELEMFPYVKDYMALRDAFLKAVEDGEIKVVQKGYSKEYSTPSLKKWCKKVGKSKGYFRSYGLSYPERDYWMCIKDGIQLDSSDERFESYVRSEHHRKLESLYYEEKQWFNKHDEYTSTSDRVSDKLRDLRISLPNLSSWCTETKDTINGEEKWRPLTLEEYRKLEKFADDYVEAQKRFIEENFPL